MRWDTISSSSVEPHWSKMANEGNLVYLDTKHLGSLSRVCKTISKEENASVTANPEDSQASDTSLHRIIGFEAF